VFDMGASLVDARPSTGSVRIDDDTGASQ
jgi:hypothetical protein